MLTKGEIIVKDACILFDLLDLKLMEDFYRLEFYVLTTIQVIAEIIDEQQLNEIMAYVNKGKLTIDKNGSLDMFQLISDENPGLSLADSSVLELAIRKNCSILSADGSLRKISTKRGLTVHGMIWVIEELCNEKIISVEQAVKKLKDYPKINQRVPRKEIDVLIEKLSESNEE